MLFYICITINVTHFIHQDTRCCDLSRDVCVFKPGPSLVGALKKDWASPNSIALSWQQPEQTTLPILDYEIKYYEKVQSMVQFMYDVGKSDFSTFLVENLF